MEIFNNYYAKNSFGGICTVQKNILMTFQYFKFSFTKGQLISKCPFGVIVSTNEKSGQILP